MEKFSHSAEFYEMLELTARCQKNLKRAWENDKMSWVLEAIEREAMNRALQKSTQFDVRMFGLTAKQVAAFILYFEERCGSNPAQYDGDTILAKLRAAHMLKEFHTVTPCGGGYKK